MVASCIVEDNFPAVLNPMHTRNDSDLIIVCPAYKAMAVVPKSPKMARLQYFITKVLVDQGIEHLVVIVTPEMFTIFASIKCHHVVPDSLTSGFLGNLFLWGACNKEATNSLNHWAWFIHVGENRSLQR